MRRFWILSLLLVALTVCFAPGCRKKLPPRHSPQSLIGEKLPPIRINRIDVGPTSLKAEEGKPTILALWATWCEPCHKEIPALVHWWRMRDDVNLIVLNVDELSVDLTEIRRMAADFRLEAPVLATTPAKASPLGLRALPVMYVLDESATVVKVTEGFVHVDAMTSWLEDTLEGL